MLKSPFWFLDYRVNQAAKNNPPMRVGESEAGSVKLLQEALISFEFPVVDTPGVYGGGTKAAVTAFQNFFGLSPDGSAGKQVFTYLDDLLMGTRSKQRVVPSAQTARQRCMAAVPQTLRWIRAGRQYTRTAKSIVNGAPFQVLNPTHQQAYLALLLHFRVYFVRVLKGSLPGLEKYTPPASQLRMATAADIDVVDGMLAKIEQLLLNTKPENLFKDSPQPKDEPNGAAACPVGRGPIHLFPALAGNRPTDSYCWITVHELGHWVGGTETSHDKASKVNPYSHKPNYWALNWDGCKMNPDCYSHLATHAAKGAPQFSPW